MASAVSESRRIPPAPTRYRRPVTSTEPDSAPGQRKLFEQSTAANDGSFTLGDWGLFLAVALIWGSSFLFID